MGSDNIDRMFENLLNIVKSLAETNGSINVFLELIERKAPDKNDLLDIKNAIGKGSKTVVELLENIQDIKNFTKIYDQKRLIKCFENVKNINDYVENIKKRDYTDEDKINLGKHVVDLSRISDFIDIIKKRGKIIIGSIVLFFILWKYSSNIINFFTKG